VTRKISHAVASIYLGKQEKLELGNIAAYRDWGYAPDYVKAMWMMLQQEKPDDYVIGTGKTHTVSDFVCAAFKVLGMDWTKYTIANTANVMRPGEVNYLLADATKARTKLGWKPETSFEKLVRIMVKHDLKELQEAK
jgi:GDPmannose 4,6-dehydratase